MNTSVCPVSLSEICSDLISEQATAGWLQIKSEMRDDVISVADRVIRGEEVHAYRHKSRHTRELAMIDFVEHPLSDDAIFAAWNGDRMPLTDLLTRIVQREVAVAWYGETDADELGFIK